MIGMSEMDYQLCLYTDDQNFNCRIEELPPVYPGQKYSLKLIAYNISSTVLVEIKQGLNTACKSKTKLAVEKLFNGSCTAVDFTLILCSKAEILVKHS